MNRTISIRNAKMSKIGLQEMCNFILSKVGKNITLVEIGSFAGDSAEIFAKNFKTVICVDPWKSGYDANDTASDPTKYDMRKVESQFDEVAKENKNIIKLKNSSKEASLLVDFVDVIYIDALHTEKGVLDDLCTWMPHVKDGGIYSGHDFGCKQHPGVELAVRSTFLEKKIYTFPDTSWLVLK